VTLLKNVGWLLLGGLLIPAFMALTLGAGLVIVAEDRWAVPLAAAASSVGGRIAAGERIPANRVERALATLSGGD
jgi:hypothetical protein